MSSIGRSCEHGVEGIVNFINGINQRLDENHLIDMLVTLHDEEISVSKFQEFTETIHQLRSGKKVNNSTSTTTTTNG